MDGKREEIDIEEALLSANFFWGIEDETEFLQLINHLVRKLVVIRQLPEGMLTLSLDASIELDRYRLEKYNEAVRISNVNILDKDGNLIARLAQSAMRLAGIHCIGRYAEDYDPEEHLQKMEISKEDALWGIAKANRHFNHYKKLQTIAPEVVKSVTKSYTSDHDRILSLLPKIKEEGKPPTLAQFMRLTGWKRTNTQEILDAMVVIGKLIMYEKIKASKKKQLITLYKRGPEAR